MQVPADIPPSDWAGVLSPRVFDNLPTQGLRVFTVDNALSDTEACSAAYGIALEDCANTLVLKAKIAGGERYVAAVTLATRRLDVNGLVRAALQAQKVSFAPGDFVAAQSGMESGGVTAFGLPPDWLVLVDSAVLLRDRVVMGAGRREAKLDLPAAALRDLHNVVVADISHPK